MFRQLSTWVAIVVAAICIGLGGLATHTLLYKVGETSTTPAYCGGQAMQPGETCKVTSAGHTEYHGGSPHTEKQGATAPIIGVVISAILFVLCVVFLFRRWKAQSRT